MTQTTDHPTQAADVVGDLAEGDTIRVPQYETPLYVCYEGEVNGDPYLGIEFVENATSATKSLVVNTHSGRVYLTAGQSDKGEVEEIEVL